MKRAPVLLTSDSLEMRYDASRELLLNGWKKVSSMCQLVKEALTAERGCQLEEATGLFGVVCPWAANNPLWYLQT